MNTNNSIHAKLLNDMEQLFSDRIKTMSERRYNKLINELTERIELYKGMKSMHPRNGWFFDFEINNINRYVQLVQAPRK